MSGIEIRMEPRPDGETMNVAVLKYDWENFRSAVAEPLSIEDSQCWLARPLAMREIGDHQCVENPTIVMSVPAVQRLMDHLWGMGFRPTHDTGVLA